MAVPLEMMVHPELLSNEQLINVIQERHLRVPNVQNMARDDLLDLFHNFCVPYGQRQYRDKGRGKILNKSRQIEPEPPIKLYTNNLFISHTNSCNGNGKILRSDNYERLKPPPDTLAGHMKRIRVSTLAVPIGDNNGDNNILKRKISFSSDNPATGSPPQKKERKPITWP